jgi:hypothetical protein
MNENNLLFPSRTENGKLVLEWNLAEFHGEQNLFRPFKEQTFQIQWNRYFERILIQETVANSEVNNSFYLSQLEIYGWVRTKIKVFILAKKKAIMETIHFAFENMKLIILFEIE